MSVAHGKTFLPNNPAPVEEKKVEKPAPKKAKSEVPKEEASKE